MGLSRSSLRRTRRGEKGYATDKGKEDEIDEGFCITNVHQSIVNDVVVFTDCNIVTVSDDQSVATHSRSAREGFVTRSRIRGSDAISIATFSNASGCIVTASQDATLQAITPSNSRVVASKRRVHTSRPTGLCATGDLICSGSRDTSICLFDARTLQRRHRSSVSRNIVTNMCAVDEVRVRPTCLDTSHRMFSRPYPADVHRASQRGSHIARVGRACHESTRSDLSWI